MANARPALTPLFTRFVRLRPRWCLSPFSGSIGVRLLIPRILWIRVCVSERWHVSSRDRAHMHLRELHG